MCNKKIKYNRFKRSSYILSLVAMPVAVASLTGIIALADGYHSNNVDSTEVTEETISALDVNNENTFNIVLETEAEESTEVEEETTEESTETAEEKVIDAFQIRCTGYCDYGYTKSGEYVRDGIIAGKDEWLGRTCNLYRINSDGSIGELIGSYEFLDTGAGIDTNGDGIGDSIRHGKSVDVWHPSKDAVWDWMAEYGDYVYIEFTS